MAAKLLQSLADENPDLHKQIGCMTGIFQIFDRHHVITGKRITHRRLPHGDSSSGNGSFERQSNSFHYQQTSADPSVNKSVNVNERQRLSTESSRASFSSACSSSASSLDLDRSAQQEASSCDLGRQSLDLREVVKDSMYREARILSVKTTPKEEASMNRTKHRDSPRPSQNSQADLKESLRVLAKLREAPWHYNDARDAPRFSYDGRETTNRASFESAKSAAKLKDLPRLSLDSREIHGASFDPRARISKSRSVSNEREHGLPQRPPGVVAKLMGLDALPESSLVDGKSPAKPLRVSDLSRPIRAPGSPTSPRWRNPDLVMKPVSRFPLEPAPWKTLDANRAPQRTSTRSLKFPAPRRAANSFPSVLSEIEKRMKDVEFKQSGKDLRALKQILEAMQAKGLLESGRGDELRSNEPELNHVSGSGSSRSFESPIVIMKPAKLVEKPGTCSSSVVSADSLSVKRGSSGGRAGKDQGPRYNRRDGSVTAIDKRGSSRGPKPGHSSSRAQQAPADSAKGSGSVSPRLQQKKLEMERRARPPTAPAAGGSSKPRRLANRQPPESSSPGGRSRAKSPASSQQQYCDDQLSEASNESKTLSFNGDDASKSDAEVTSDLRKKATPRLEEDEPLAELASAAPEHPSPVSVLDNSPYKDDEPSPVKQIKGDDSWGCSDWRPVESSEMNRKKLENIESLVRKLRRLNSSHDEARTDYIASLCEKTNPEHRYISEILLASGLLLRDLGSATVQLHPSGHPINPELFFVLEQTKASKSEARLSDGERLRRRLIFDAVNEALVGKLASVNGLAEPWLRPGKLAGPSLSAQKLLKELCHEIEQLEAGFEAGDDDGEDDSLKRILCEDVMRRSGSWVDFSGEISGVVLDVERSIFKELVDEIVRGEAVVRPGRRRKLFAK